MELRELINQEILVLDGAMGTMLQGAGLRLGENPECLCITSPETVQKVHEAYLLAGSQVVLTNTFGANAHKLAGTGYTVNEIVSAAVTVAKKAANRHSGFVGLDIGPIGELLEPMGTLSFESAYELFKEQVVAGVKAGADGVFIETMTDLYEMKAALLAVKENSELPVVCTMSFEQDMRTFTGCSLSAMALTLEGLGADAIGINCSLGPIEILPMARELRRWTTLPIAIKPNAGLPVVINGETTFNINPQEFAAAMKEIIDLGVSVVGGCCGTTPEHIRALKEITAGVVPVKIDTLPPTAVCSNSKTVEIDRVRVIGERINPTGKKLFKEALLKGDMDYVVRQAIEQTEAGADILDVNVGLPGIDQKQMIVRVVKKLQSLLDIPLQIDSTDKDVIEAALRVYNGKAIVNSVNGEGKVMDDILPIVKKYGAAVVGLTLDEKGIPPMAEQRFAVAKTILDRCLQEGIPRRDVYIDCLTLTAGAEQALAYQTLEAVAMVKEGLGLKTVLGVSNISFGLPARETMNKTFLTLAMGKGLDLPIINPNNKEMMDAVACFHQLKNIDEGSADYIRRFADAGGSAPAREQTKPQRDIAYCIAKGLGEGAAECTRSLLESVPPLEIVSGELIPALDKVGADYEAGKLFLPQLMQAAEAAKAAFDVIRKHIAATGSESVSRGTIVIATVKGDVHDIGKNIVKVVLENYGYTMIDLGRDVDPELVALTAQRENAKLVGLSALMTTTVKSMEETIKLLRALDCKVMVGGAVLTSDYAEEIGADFYAKDPQGAVAIANKVFGY